MSFSMTARFKEASKASKDEGKGENGPKTGKASDLCWLENFCMTFGISEQAFAIHPIRSGVCRVT